MKLRLQPINQPKRQTKVIEEIIPTPGKSANWTFVEELENYFVDSFKVIEPESPNEPVTGCAMPPQDDGVTKSYVTLNTTEMPMHGHGLWIDPVGSVLCGNGSWTTINTAPSTAAPVDDLFYLLAKLVKSGSEKTRLQSREVLNKIVDTHPSCSGLTEDERYGLKSAFDCVIDNISDYSELLRSGV